MSLNSWEEDALFEAYGWYKDLIKRRYESPDGTKAVSFDSVASASMSGLEGEAAIINIIRKYGEKPNAG